VKLDDGLNYTFRASLDRRIGTFWVGGGFARSLWYEIGATNLTPQTANFVQSAGENGFYDLVTLRFSGQPTRDTAILVDTGMARAVSSANVASNKSLLGRVRLDYRATERSTLFTSFDTFQQTRNAYVLAPVARNRWMVGIEFALSGETTRQAYRTKEEAQYVALTDHQRQRPAAPPQH